MFWRFGGYANISTLDTILEKPDVTLEELLDESDLIQELKQHNTKLIEFLRDDKILRRLLEYVIAPKPAPPQKPTLKNDGGDSDDDEDEDESDRIAVEAEREKTRLRYAYVSCEVLSSEAWSLLEALMQNIDHLRMFWTFLERPPPLDPLQASYFTKVNETLLDKKTEEMMSFVRSLDGIVPRILKHVDCPMIMDLLLKIISMEKCEGGAGIVDWLHSQNLIPLLLSFLSSEHSQSTQTASGDFIKALITISANASQNEQSCIGPNDLTRQLVSQECILGLISDMLKGGNPLTVGVGIIIEVIRKNNSDYDPDIGTGVDSIPSSRDPIYLGTLLRLFASHVPDFMKLIMSYRHTTNADGSKNEGKRELKVAFGGAIEPLGFDRFKTCELMAELLHCSNMGLLNEKGGERYVKERDRERERLKAARLQHMFATDELVDHHAGVEGVVVEKAPLQVQNGGVEMSDDGINEEEFEDVIISGMLDDAQADADMECEGLANIHDIHDEVRRDDDEDLFVDEPLSPPEPKDTIEDTTEAVMVPIPSDEASPLDTTSIEPQAPTKDAEVPTPTQETKQQCDVQMTDAPPAYQEKEDPVPAQQSGEAASREMEVPTAPSPPAATAEVDGSERSLVEDLKAAEPTPLSPQPPLPAPPQKPETESLAPSSEQKKDESPQPDEEENLMDLNGTPDTTIAEGNVSVRSAGSLGSSFTEYQAMVEPDLDGNPVVGDYLKMMFVEHKVVPTILEFFFRFPWNNFLHNVVYDVVQQVFNGPMDRGYNRALAIDLFVAGRITERIVEGQKYSDKFEAERRMRLGYMGHLTLVAEEVVKFAERHPPEVLGPKVLEKVSDPIWIEYVEETLAATRERDNAILGGVRPDMHLPRIAGMGSVQSQAFNSNASTAGTLTLGAGLDNIDIAHIANGNNAGTGGNGREGGLLSSGFGSSSDEEDEDMEHDEDDDGARMGLGGSDQFASYISHEISSVDKFGSSDEEDEDDDDVSFATAPSEPPPPPPLPLNIKRAQHRTQIEDAEKEAEGLENMEDLDSSDEEDMLQGSLFRRRINSTHEAKIRELLEDEEDEFLSEGIRALDIRSPITTYESREVAPGEFYGHPRREEPAVPTSIEEKEVPLSEKVPVGEAKEDEAKGKGLPEEKA